MPVDIFPLAFFGLAAWLVNPAIFLAGAGLVSLPIIIHLLNKRKFQIVDWAAMEFLLDADKKNRRRVRLENLILLLLRCLAVFLIGMLLARPFLPSSITAGLLDAAQYERIVVLDDSLSMQVRQGNDATWDTAKKQLIDLVRGLANQPSNNTLTLITTSNPQQRLFNATNLGKNSVDEIVVALEKLEATDGVAQFDQTLQELEKYLASQPANVNRVLYLLSDVRARDWVGGEDNLNRPTKLLERISKNCAGTFVVDVAEAEDRNVTITDVRPEGTLVAGVTSRMDVTIANPGSTEVRDLKVRLTTGDSLPLTQEIDRLAAGESQAVAFSVVFSVDEQSEAGLLPPRQVKIEVQTAKQGEDDRLAADSVVYFPARVVPGIPVLLVDGDPSADYGKSETFYLKRALSPKGGTPSGIAVEIATEQELEALQLSKFQVIVLCNVYRLGEKTAEAIANLEKWVQNGGGLVIFPGDQGDEQFFDEHYFKDGNGLSPFKLDAIRGDETELTWVKMRMEKASHPVLQVFAGQNNPFLDNVKTFRWWHAILKKEQLNKDVSVLARYNDADDSPALVEKPFGKGRVIAAAIPADADWANWTTDPSYLITMQELVRYLNGDRGSQGMLRVGQPLQQPLDLSQYEIDATLMGPKERKVQLQAVADATVPNGTEGTIWTVGYQDTNHQGFYNLKLTRRDGPTEQVLFAANVDPTEGNLRRADFETLRKEMGEKVQILSGGQAAALGKLGDTSELWWYLLFGVAGVLGIEQLLAWWFGRRR